MLSSLARSMLAAALKDPAAQERYRAKIATPDGTSCQFWIGALHPKGHGRFWVGAVRDGDGAPREVCVIAHRFGWALEHGLDALDDVPVLAHQCDEPSCQNPNHLLASDWSQNLAEWQARRWRLASPLRDTRGPGGRARAIRSGLRHGEPLEAILAAGHSELDRNQLELF